MLSLFILFFTVFRKPIPNSTSRVEKCPKASHPFLCKESHQCLRKDVVCDGHIQCDKGEDESLELCKEKHVCTVLGTRLRHDCIECAHRRQKLYADIGDFLCIEKRTRDILLLQMY